MLNYRPISNPPFISKIIEKDVSQQMNTFLKWQTALIIFSLISLTAQRLPSSKFPMTSSKKTDCDRTTIPVLLDISAAFDTVDRKNITGMMGELGRTLWYSSMVWVLPQEQEILCVNREFHIRSSRNCLWGPPGFHPGTPNVHYLHTPTNPDYNSQ